MYCNGPDFREDDISTFGDGNLDGIPLEKCEMVPTISYTKWCARWPNKRALEGAMDGTDEGTIDNSDLGSELST